MATLGGVVIGGALWVAALPEPYSPTHYVLKWKNTGLCTVVRERPEERNKYKIVWFTTLKRVAYRKAKEFKKSGKCGRVALQTPQPQQRL